MQFGESGSFTVTLVSVTVPVFVTVIEKFAVPPDEIVCDFGFFVIAIAGVPPPPPPPPPCHVFWASPEPPAFVLTGVFVARVIDWPLTDSVLAACTTVVPEVPDVITTVHVGVAAV